MQIGPSGGCLTEDHLDLPLDFDSLQEAGAAIGFSERPQVIMDDTTCIVEVARFFMDFTQNESCGKCVLCREDKHAGYPAAVVDGEVPLSWMLLKSVRPSRKARCAAMGKTAPNPVLTTMKYFRDEYLARG